MQADNSGLSFAIKWVVGPGH